MDKDDPRIVIEFRKQGMPDYDPFSLDEKGRSPLLAKWQDEREAEELAKTQTKN